MIAITTTDLHLRQGPGSSYRSLAVLPIGTRLDVVAIAPGWTEVLGRGWVSSAYLRPGQSDVTPLPLPDLYSPHAQLGSVEARHARLSLEAVGEGAERAHRIVQLLDVDHIGRPPSTG